MRSIVPYFLLGVLLIIAFNLIASIGIFATHFSRFWGVISPFFSGAIIAYILNIPCNAIQRLYQRIYIGKREDGGFFRRRSRALSVVTLLIIVAALIGLVISIVVPAVSGSINAFMYDLERHEETLRGWMQSIEAWNLPAFFPEINQDTIFDFITDFVDTLNMENIVAWLVAGFGTAFSLLFTTILTIVSAIYFLIEKERLTDFMRRMVAAILPEKTNGTILKYTRKLNHNFHMYIYAQTIDGIILGTLMTGLLFIFRSEHAVLLGIILGVVNYIPYFGSIFGTAFAVVVVAFTQGVPTAALAGIFMFILQQVDGNFIQPKLMAGSFSLSPLLVIISVTIGMSYGGILGMLIAIPIVAIFKDVLDEYIEYREQKKRDEPPQPPTADEYPRELF